MDATHFHLAFTHFPIIGIMLGTLIYIISLLKKNKSGIIISLLLFVGMALLSVPVFLTGEGAEESVEHLIPHAHLIIHPHEELAETAIWIVYLLGLLSLFNLVNILRKKEVSYPLNWINALVAIIATVLLMMVGKMGGEIRHSEIRDNDQQQAIEQLKDEHQSDGDHED